MDTDCMGVRRDSDKERKESHWDICAQKPVMSGRTGFEEVSLKPQALTEGDLGQLKVTRSLFGRALSLPFFISCMTGGMELARPFNISLAEIAQSLGIPMGLGSHKVLFRHSEFFPDFKIKSHAPDVPIFSNIGALQLAELPLEWLIETNKTLEVQVQVVHLNALQELCQPSGDRNFTGLKDAIIRFVEMSPIPVIVKETGAGIRASEVVWLLEQGVSYVDLAGAGGTNWGLVESYRQPVVEQQRIQSTWTDWGIPSAYTLANLSSHHRSRVFVSGGMQSPLAAVKGLAMGAHMVGFARAVLLTWQGAGKEGVLSFFNDQEKTLKEAMVLTGTSSLEELSKGESLVLSPRFQQEFILWQ